MKTKYLHFWRILTLAFIHDYCDGDAFPIVLEQLIMQYSNDDDHFYNKKCDQYYFEQNLRKVISTSAVCNAIVRGRNIFNLQNPLFAEYKFKINGHGYVRQNQSNIKIGISTMNEEHYYLFSIGGFYSYKQCSAAKCIIWRPENVWGDMCQYIVPKYVKMVIMINNNICGSKISWISKIPGHKECKIAEISLDTTLNDHFSFVVSLPWNAAIKLSSVDYYECNDALSQHDQYNIFTKINDKITDFESKFNKHVTSYY